MPTSVDVYIWGWEGLGFGAGPVEGSVGHAMITGAGLQQVILSQFPHAFGQPSRPRGPNTMLNFDDTYAAENRNAGVVFRVQVPNESDFNAKAADHRTRPVWDWDPTSPGETHCARSCYDSLRAGGVALDPNGDYVIKDGDTCQIIPDTLWVLLNRVPGIVKINGTAQPLPDQERLNYEADVMRYVPYSNWYQTNMRRQP